MLTIPEASVAGWSPPVLVSNRVTNAAAVARFVDRARSGYVAPAIGFAAPEPVAVAGRHFAVIRRDGGLVADSIHTLGRHGWHQLFFGIERTRLYPADGGCPILVGTSGHSSFYHWTLETAGAILIHRSLAADAGPFVVAAPTQEWQAGLSRWLGIDAPFIEVEPDEMVVFDAAILTNMAGGAYGFAPHPVVLDTFARHGDLLPPGAADALVYLSRADVPGRRRMRNEAEVCRLLLDHGFSIHSTGSMSVQDQAALVRSARVIVAPHGAALTNLIYARDGVGGPAVVELFQEGYLGRSFLKIAQAKGLAYRAVINSDLGPAGYHHDGEWHCDLELLRRVLATVVG